MYPMGNIAVKPDFRLRMSSNYQAIHQLLTVKEGGETVQIWTRLGYASAAATSSRRGLQAHLEKTS